MDLKPKVTLVRSSFSTRDSRVLKELRMFVDAGFGTTLLCWDREAASPKREQRDGAVIARCRLRAPYGSKWLFVFMPLWMAYAFFFLLRAKTDAIHACDFDTILPALAAGRLKRIPVVYDIFDFYAARNRTVPQVFLGLFRRAEQWCVRRADGVIIVDEARKYLLGEKLPKRLAIAMNCPYDEVEPDWRKPEGGDLVVFYGGVIAGYRGLRKLVRATEGLAGVRVVLAGRVTDPAYEDMVRATPHVEYLGVIEYREALRRTFEADAIYAYYDPALEINRTANSGKMYDAFMCSTAVLANSEPPAAAVVAEHECGSCLPYDDDEGLRAMIERWRDDRALVRELGARGRRIFEERFNWDRAAENVLALYDELGLRPAGKEETA